MEFSVFFDKGITRKNNEDNYIILNENHPFTAAAVADGMGGHNAGEVASRTAIDFIKSYQFDLDSDIIPNLKKVINRANRKIIQLSQKNEEYQGMGTTLSLGLIYENILYFGHIGDSRIYLYRNHNLSQLTYDHTLVNELIQQKKIEKEDAFAHPQNHILTQALGLDETLSINTGCKPLKKEDVILFCTDGLTDMIKPEKIESLLQKSIFNMDEITSNLGHKALENGGKDNLTIIAGIIN